ncbi:MAG: type I-A CRISPR-associated protein Cas7/Csa2 [Thermofilaceae archaeon]
MVYLRVTGRALVNVHSANAEGAVGNYTALSKMFIVRRTPKGYEVTEDIVVSGNMVKHWHAVRMVEMLSELGYGSLCDTCKRHVMYRSTMDLNSEFEFVQACAIEDVHGFLQTDKAIRRESIVKFSFLLPVEEMRSEYQALTHNRVVVNEKGAVPREVGEMMVIKREHASGLYGLLMSFDLAYVGRPLADPSKALQLSERKLRAKAAVLALADVLTGRFGAATARALPAIRVVELIAAVSDKPLPNLIHGFYYDYIEESARILSAFSGGRQLKVYAYGDRVVGQLTKRLPKDVVVTAESPFQALADAAVVAEQWLK